jgi:hypothetical protein
MIPDPLKREVRLTDIEGDRIIPQDVQVQVLPLGRTLLDEQEPLQGDRNVWIVHRVAFSKMEWLSW